MSDRKVCLSAFDSEKALFLKAIEIDDVDQRQRFLVGACGGDQALLIRLNHLLAAAQDETLLDPDRYQVLGEQRHAFAVELAEEGRFLRELEGRGISFDDYELLEELGRGAYGVVWRARQASLNREVAVKIILGSALASASDRARFHTEAESAAALMHPNIVPIYEIGCHDNHDFYSMALIRGGTLGRLMKAKRFEPREAVRLMLTVARTLAFAHRQGVIHRDLKPDNILLDQAGQPHISDFGLACRLEQPGSLSATGLIIGTPLYMAPEQAEPSSVPPTTAIDLYSMGAILYELLTGRPLFEATSTLAMLLQIKRDTPRPPRSLKPGIDQDLETIVLKCLEKDPRARYDSAKAMADDLQAWLEHRPVAARRPTAGERLGKWVRRRPINATLLLVSALFLLTLGVGGPVAAWHQARLRHDAETARQQADQQRREAEQFRAIAERDRVAAEQAKAQADLMAFKNQSMAYSSSIRLANAVAQDPGRSLASHTMLRSWRPEPGQPDLRGWEWYYGFGNIFLSPKPVYQPGGPTRTLSFSPSGQHYVAATRDAGGSVLRDGLTSAVVRPLPDPTGSHRQVIWDHDGTRLLTVSEAGVAKLWSVGTGEIIAEVPARSPLKSISWLPRLGRIVALTDDNMIQAWRVDRDGAMTPASATPAGVPGLRAAALSPDGRYLAAIADGSGVLLWQADQIGQDPQVLDGHTAPVIDLVWHSGSRWLATSGEEGEVRVWETPAGSRLARIHERPGKQMGQTRAMVWEPQGFRLLFCEDQQNDLLMFDGPNNALTTLGRYEQPITSLDWSRSGHAILVGHHDGSHKLSRIGLPPTKRVLHRRVHETDQVQWSADGKLLASRTVRGDLTVVDSSTGQSRRKLFKTPEGQIQRIAWSPEHHQSIALVMAVQDGATVYVADTSSSGPVEKLRLAGSDVLSLVWGSKHGVMAVLTSEGNITVLKNPEHQEQAFILTPTSQESQRYRHLSISPDGRWLLATGDPTHVVLWDLENGLPRVITTPQLGGHAVTNAWHPNSTHIAVGHPGGAVTVWDIEKFERAQRLTTASIQAPHLAWHPDGTRLVTAGDDKHAHIWIWETGHTPLSLKGPEAPITGVAWSPGGIKLACSSEDGTLRVWDATAGYLMNPTAGSGR